MIPKKLISVATLLFCFALTGFSQAQTPRITAEQAARDSAERARKQLDSLRRNSPSVGTNLLYWGSSSPNVHFWIPIGENFTVGMVGGIKPWPRWAPWDYDQAIESKWRHFAIVPGIRWWPKENYRGLWLGADLLWTHYNVGGVRFPFDMYPITKDHRIQGDFFGLGINIGWSWWLTKHLRLEAEAGVAAGYGNANVYECAWCGALVGKHQGPGIVPKLGLNLAYNFFKEKKIEPVEVIDTPLDTLVPPVAVAAPAAFLALVPVVEEWKGIAGQLEKDHPVLRPSSEYKPYTPDRILRKEESPLYVFFELDKTRLLRNYTENGHFRDNGPVLDEIMDITAKIMADTTSRVTKIQIIGLASIEGSRKHNVALADNRALALQRYIQQRIDIPDSMFDTVGGGEAWSEFRDQVNDLLLEGGGAGLTKEQLQEVIDIIDNEKDADRREARIRRLEGGNIHKSLLERILSDQRNSGYLRIYYDYVPDESAREINEAIECLQRKDYAEALRLLELKRDDPRSDNAYAVALFYNGREEEAMAVLKEAVARGDEAAEKNLQQLQAIAGQRAAYARYLQEMEEYSRLRYGR